MIENKCIIQISFMHDAGKLFDTLKLIFSTQTWQTVGWSDFGDNNKIVNSASSAQLFWDPSSKILKSCFLSWWRNLKWAKHLKKGYSIFKSKNLKETKFFPLSQNKFLKEMSPAFMVNTQVSFSIRIIALSRAEAYRLVYNWQPCHRIPARGHCTEILHDVE